MPFWLVLKDRILFLKKEFFDFSFFFKESSVLGESIILPKMTVFVEKTWALVVFEPSILGVSIDALSYTLSFRVY